MLVFQYLLARFKLPLKIFRTVWPIFVERKVRYSALFTKLVRWHAGVVSFPLSDVILAQLACLLSDIMFCLHSGITNLSLNKHRVWLLFLSKNVSVMKNYFKMLQNGLAYDKCNPKQCLWLTIHRNLWPGVGSHVLLFIFKTFFLLQTKWFKRSISLSVSSWQAFPA